MRTVLANLRLPFQFLDGHHMLGQPEADMMKIAERLGPVALLVAAMVVLVEGSSADQDGLAPIEISENGRFLQFADGRPFFWLADTGWEMFHRASREDARLYLDTRAEQGFTVIQAVALAEKGGLDVPTPAGHTPLRNNDPATPDVRDGPDNDYWDDVDYMIDYANSRGMYVALWAAWGSMVADGPEVLNPGNARAYGAFLGERYGDEDVIFVLGGDRESNVGGNTPEVWSALAEGIRATDPGPDQLISFHPWGEESSTEMFPNTSQVIDFNLVHGSHKKKSFGELTTLITEDYGKSPVKPVIDSEVFYEEHPFNWDSSVGWKTAVHARGAAYYQVFSGAAGHTYGNGAVHQFWEPGMDAPYEVRDPWYDAINHEGATQMQYLKELMLSRSYFDRIPDQNLIAAGTGRATRAESGDWAMIYLPRGGSVQVVTSALAGPVAHATWFNPRTGESQADESAGGATYTAPDAQDWVLILDANRTVGQWDRFEAAVTNPKPYADPYRDVELRVTYTKPSGASVEFWGFYNGGETWTIRFMPDQPGTWTYSARFSDGSPGRDGTFQVFASDVPGMISVDEGNPLWFGFKGGRHVLIRSFHVGDRFFAENWDDPADARDGNKRTIFMDWARRQGYNMFSIGSHYLNREAEGRGEGWDTPDLWPLNAAEYAKMERILDELASRRIMVFPFGGFFGRDSDFPRDSAEQELYIRYTIARLGPYWNSMFNVGGPEPLLEDRSYLTREDVNRLGRTIERLDIFGHPLTVHNPGGGDEFRDESWLDYGTLQGPKTGDLKELSADLLQNHHPRKPLYAQETLWSGNIYHIRDLGGRDYTDDELRKNAYVINLSATALNFADNDGDSSSGFSGSLELSDAAQARHDVVKRVWDFFETIPFYRMAPCQERVSAGYCLGEEGEQYLVYLPEGGSVDVQLPAGPYAAEWINARDPSRRLAADPVRADGRLTAPAEGDWLLYLIRHRQD